MSHQETMFMFHGFLYEWSNKENTHYFRLRGKLPGIKIENKISFQYILVSWCLHRQHTLLKMRYMHLTWFWPIPDKTWLRGLRFRQGCGQLAQLRRLAIVLKYCMQFILSMERSKKALTSLRLCAGWSVSLLFACNTIILFSREVCIIVLLLPLS